MYLYTLNNEQLKLTTMEKQASQNQISTFKTLVSATAIVLTVRPIVEKIQTEVLAANNFTSEEGERITNIKDCWEMNNTDFTKYDEILHVKYIAAGFDVKPGYCPLLIAEQIEREAKRAFAEACHEWNGMGFTTHSLMCAGMDKYDRYIDVNMRYVCQYAK